MIDPAHLILRLHDAHRHPALPLIAVHPVLHLSQILAELAVQALDRVRCLEALTELLEDAQAMQRECLLKTLHHRIGCAAI